MNKEKLEKIVMFKPAFDKRHSDPSKNYGVGAVVCFMVLKGEEKSVSFVFSTGMYLEKVYDWWESRGLKRSKIDYMGYDVGYHDIKPHFEGQEISQKKCEWFDGKPCYGDGSTLRADDFMKILLEEGSKGIWRELEKDYWEKT